MPHHCSALTTPMRAAEPEPAAAGSRAAELATTVFLFASMVLSWFAFADVGFGHHDSHVRAVSLDRSRAISRSSGHCASTR